MRIGVILAFLATASAALAQDQQLGARTKAMGGSYTAFEDDPVSIWLNPAGIATQADQFSIVYQTYPAYEVEVGGGPANTAKAEAAFVEPAVVPGYVGFVFQMGSADSPMAVGACFARPFHLKYVLDDLVTPGTEAEGAIEQSLSRFRVAFAKDFRFTKAGKPGFLTHLALGLGIDLGYERWEFIRVEPTFDTVTDNGTSFGGGAGLLLGLYDNTETLKVNVGVAYQSAVRYDFNIDRSSLPAFDMPQQVNAGVTVYLLKGTPLRLTFDAQWIDWDDTAEEPSAFAGPGREEFEDALSFSAGAEYRIDAGNGVYIYPRVGFRKFDAPWDDEDDLPTTGTWQLLLDTDDEMFDVFTFGVGLTWNSAGGKLHSLDIAGDVGGDAANFAVGFTREF